jgi:SAM-dependent methyltransferase
MNVIPGDPDPVQLQYERWPYPAPPDDLSTLRYDPPHSYYLQLRDLYWAYWPALPYREDLDILVAGCGSMSAAAYAFLYPRAHVVGIDISAASLAHEEFLKGKHALPNLTLHPCRVEEAASLGRDFDFVAVQGVLHHLADPVAGLAALGRVLRPDGVIGVMVYGKYARAGVYMLQELFRLLGLGQTETDVRVVQETLHALGPDHPVQFYLRRARDLSSANGLVDTFLHRRDRAFSVADCLDLVESAGLTFQGWDENFLYYPDALGGGQSVLGSRVAQLEAPRLWQAMELLYCLQAMHWFHVCRRDRDPASYRIPLEGPAFLDYVPVPHIAQAIPADPVRGSPATISRPPLPAATLDQGQAALFSQIDGQRTVRQCLRAVGLQPDLPAHVEYGRRFVGSLWRLGFLLFRLPGPASS